MKKIQSFAAQKIDELTGKKRLVIFTDKADKQI